MPLVSNNQNHLYKSRTQGSRAVVLALLASRHQRMEQTKHWLQSKSQQEVLLDLRWVSVAIQRFWPTKARSSTCNAWNGAFMFIQLRLPVIKMLPRALWTFSAAVKDSQRLIISINSSKCNKLNQNSSTARSFSIIHIQLWSSNMIVW